jgi:hypothetical protein
MRGTTYDGAIHLADFFPTFMSVATAGLWHANFAYSLDGIDMWPALLSGGTSPRNVTVLNVLDDTGGIRVGNYVLLIGAKSDGWYPQPDMKTGYKSPRFSSKEKLKEDCASVSLNAVTGLWAGDECNYLFDVVNDVTEETNLYDNYPDIVATLTTLLQQYIAEAVDYNENSDKEDAAKEQAASTGYWGPWVDTQKDVDRQIAMAQQ